jgi:hypothetical protein
LPTYNEHDNLAIIVWLIVNYMDKRWICASTNCMYIICGFRSASTLASCNMVSYIFHERLMSVTENLMQLYCFWYHVEVSCECVWMNSKGVEVFEVLYRHWKCWGRNDTGQYVLKEITHFLGTPGINYCTVKNQPLTYSDPIETHPNPHALIL